MKLKFTELIIIVLIPRIIRDSLHFLEQISVSFWFASISFSSDLDRSCNPGQDTLHRNRRNCVSTSQVALHDSLKSILHAGYPRLNRFIGDYSSAFRKEDRRNEDWKYPILPEASKKIGFIILDVRPFVLLFREWRASHYRKERIIESAYT